ncbi:MAG TPA: A/G-specific adenine glycosylase [Planctomycetaceae bacterium]|nr:A/G-specific adenine glycosylase [Planctomycetaceae bacterium]
MLEIDSQWLRRFRRSLIAWYAKNARDLPWRRSRDPYRVWISEIMLQQTTVAAVVPYFERFLARFPTIQSLAGADEDDVLRLWEGLGYYSRARNIHRTARTVVAEYEGRFPADLATLVKLPGIGRYTAGAIVSFAFNRPAPIVEANTLRLYSRLLGFRGDPRSTAGQRVLWGFAEHVLPRREAGRFNQALMELGSTVCTPVDPRCDACPVRPCCRAAADGAQHEIPRPAARPQVIDVTEACLAIHRRGRYLLRRRGPHERWAGLWDFPRYAAHARSPGRLAAMARESLGIDVQVVRRLTELRHAVTRFRIRLVCYLAECQSGCVRSRPDVRWVRPGEFDRFALSVSGRKLAASLLAR